MDFFTKLPRVTILDGRRDYVIQQCAGKRVLHLGCVDAGVLDERWQAGMLLHQKMMAVTDQLWGSDIDAAGIRFLQEKGVPNLYSGDATQLDDLAPFKDIPFDVIVAAEIVEHLLNPGLFLDAVKTLMQPNTRLIISVPNAYAIDSFLSMLRGVEHVHPDHNYWFSYVTITNLLKKRGYAITQVLTYSNALVPFWYRPKQTGLGRYVLSLFKRLLARGLYRITPFWGDGLIVIARYPENVSGA